MPSAHHPTPSPVYGFVDYLNAQFKESGQATFVAFRLAGATIVAAREWAGEQLEEFVVDVLHGEEVGQALDLQDYYRDKVER